MAYIPARMELRQLRGFREVAVLLSFSQAARRLRLTQPALSRQIRSMEDELGVRLLDRSTTSVALTREGVHFLERVQDVLNAFDRAVLSTQQLQAQRSSEITIAVDWNVPTPIAASVHLLRARHPGVRVHYLESISPKHFELVQSGVVDVAVVPAQLVPKRSKLGGVDVVPVGAIPLRLLVPASHRLNHGKHVRLSDLKDESWIGLDEKIMPSFRSLFAEFLGASGLRPRITKVTANTQSVIPMVAAGLGISLIPLPMIPTKLHDVAVLTLTDVPNLDLRAVRQHDAGKLVEAFIDCLKASTKEGP
jgi:DNA-binding transcriptional LysR family regulator